MTYRATMIIFHAPDVLEFAADGRSLGKARHEAARGAFQHIAGLEPDVAQHVIADLFIAVQEKQPENPTHK